MLLLRGARTTPLVPHQLRLRDDGFGREEVRELKTKQRFRSRSLFVRATGSHVGSPFVVVFRKSLSAGWTWLAQLLRQASSLVISAPLIGRRQGATTLRHLLASETTDTTQLHAQRTAHQNAISEARIALKEVFGRYVRFACTIGTSSRGAAPCRSFHWCSLAPSALRYSFQKVPERCRAGS